MVLQQKKYILLNGWLCILIFLWLLRCIENEQIIWLPTLFPTACLADFCFSILRLELWNWRKTWSQDESKIVRSKLFLEQEDKSIN